MRAIRLLLAFALAAASLVVALAPVAVAVPIPGGDITAVCTGTTAGTTFTLTADCGEVTTSLTVPDGFTVEGGGHVITATDPDASTSFSGGVVTNAPGATSMHVNNVIIQATGFAFHGAQNCESSPGVQLVQIGLFFNDADGTATDVIVRDITQNSGCQTGNGIRANANAGTARTVTLTHVTVTGFMKNGVTGSGQVTLDVGGSSTIGPPDDVPGSNATNGVQYGGGGAGGTFTGNTVIGSGSGTQGSASTAILLSGAANVTIANNTITGAGTDLGVGVYSSTNVTISNNAVGRTAPNSPDATGIGIDVGSDSSATLICNTFSGWITNIAGATQPPCTDLVMTKTASTEEAIAGDPVTYTLTASNAGPEDATGVVVLDVLPSGVELVSATGCTTSGQLLRCDVGPLVVGASVSFTVIVQVAPTAPLGTAMVNTALVASVDVAEIDTTNNVDSVTTTVTEPLPPTVRDTARFVALTPARILDTRAQNAQVGYMGSKPGPGATVEVQVTGRGGVPTDNVTAVVMTVTATEPTGEGFVTVWPTGEARPVVSSLNARPEPSAPSGEQAVPNLVTMPVGVNGRVSIYTQTGTDLLVDVAGYYEGVADSAEGRFVSVGDPVRVLDTRPESGPLGYAGAKPAAGQTVTFQVAGQAGVPASGASAVVLNVTAADATERGFVTAFPGGQALPWASNLNLEYAGQTVADQVVVPLGSAGDVSLYTQSGTHLIADVAGWFTGPAAPTTTSGLFRAISPERHLDTRPTGSPVPAGGTVNVPTASALIPAAAVGTVIANVTATEALAPGFVTAYPDGSPLPWASNLNLERAGQTLPNHVTVSPGPSGAFTLYTQSGAHLVADLFGWYLA